MNTRNNIAVSGPGVTYVEPDPAATGKFDGPVLSEWIGGPVDGYWAVLRDHWTASVDAADIDLHQSSTFHASRGGALLALETILGYYWRGSTDLASGVTDQCLASRPVPETVLARLRALEIPPDATYITISFPGLRRTSVVYRTREGQRHPDRSVYASLTVTAAWQ